MQYPDVLGKLTAESHMLGPVQVALTTRPTAPQPGSVFEVVVVVQNIRNVPVDLTLTFTPPAQIKTQSPQVQCQVGPGEVGFLSVPAKSAPTLPLDDSYPLAVEVKAEPVGKGEMIREGGGAAFDPKTAPPEVFEQMAALRQLQYGGQMRGLFRKSTVELPLIFQAGDVPNVNILAGWHSLWTLENTNQLALLVDQCGEAFRQQLLPRLDKNTLFDPLARETHRRFKAANYPLNKTETITATRLLLAVTEAARGQMGTVNVGILDVNSVLLGWQKGRKEGRDLDDMPRVFLPRWAESYLRLIARDGRAASIPEKLLPGTVYDALLHDALLYGLKLVERTGGEDLGTDDEMADFVQNVVTMLANAEPLDFSRAYMPFILGGIIVSDQVLFKGETVAEVMKAIRFLLDEREAEWTDANAPVFDLAETVMEMTLKKYGFMNNR
jgi:hypothetical protein